MPSVSLLLEKVDHVCTAMRLVELRSKALDQVKGPLILRIVTLVSARSSITQLLSRRMCTYLEGDRIAFVSIHQKRQYSVRNKDGFETILLRTWLDHKVLKPCEDLVF